MKRIKKLASIVLAMVMVLAMALPVMASEPTEVKQNATLTIKGDVKAGKQYDLYRVFDLTYSEADGNKHYSYTVNDAFKGYFTAEKIDDPVAYLESLETNSSELSVLAQSLLKYAVENKIETAVPTVKATEADQTAKKIKVENLPFGYYLLNPLGGSTPTEGFATMFALNTLSGSDMEIVLKATYPEIDKNVTDDNEETPDKQDETSIGKVVTFHLTKMKVPDTTGYNRYWFVIEDKLSAGLDFEEITSVKVGSKTLTASEYTLTGPTEVVETVNGEQVTKSVIRLAINNFKDLVTNNNIPVGADITVDYTATLNENAVVNAPNKNEVTLIYSNDPTSNYDGDEPGPDSDVPVGVTPPSETGTYTTALRINKTDGTNPLQGAAFKISGTGVKTVVTTYGEFEVAADGTHWKLKDETYTTTDPNGEGIDKSVYAEPLTTKYKLVTKTEIVETTEATEVEVYTDANGQLTFKGLGEGEYRISETVVPSGYNAIDDFPVKITFVPGTNPDKPYDGGTFEVVRGEYDSNGKAVYTNGTVLGYNSTIQAYPMEVVNETGSLLPSTGGIGTTIFYVVGAVLAIGAGILLVTKKRMSVR